MAYSVLRAVLALAILLPIAHQAQGHDWYTGYANPTTKKSCCGVNDCKRVPASALTFVFDGYIHNETGKFMPRKDTLPSIDEDFHVCHSAKELFCIFVPRVPGS